MDKLSFSLKKSVKFLLVLSLLGSAFSIYAKPDLKPLAENIADQGSLYYQFQVKTFKSKDQKRTYKVWLGIPKKQIQNDVYASIFMLDGNAVMDKIKEPLLKKLSEKDPPVLVAIGYDSQLPFESKLRSLDYTPADETGKPSVDPRNPERESGGSQAFALVIKEQITPWVESKVKLNHYRKVLWGHSYGGLFVIDRFLHDDQFSHYFAASPSLSWADARTFKNVAKTDSTTLKNKNLMLMEGDLNLTNQIKVSPNLDRNMIQNNRKLISELHEKGANTKFLIYPDLSHGQVFQASLMDVLNNHLF